MGCTQRARGFQLIRFEVIGKPTSTVTDNSIRDAKKFPTNPI